jgi:hypothetical protein
MAFGDSSSVRLTSSPTHFTATFDGALGETRMKMPSGQYTDAQPDINKAAIQNQFFIYTSPK